MAGVKRRTGYRKTVTDDVLYGVPELPAGHRVAVLLRSHGGNLLELRTDGGDVGIAMLPTKYRKLIWIKRGDFLVVSEAAGDIHVAGGGQGAVRFLVEAVLYPDAIKALQRQGKWPAAFAGGAAAGAGGAGVAAPGRALPPEEGDGADGEDAAPSGGGSSWGHRRGGGGRGLPSDEEEDEEGAHDGDGAASADLDGVAECDVEERVDSFGNTTRHRRAAGGGVDDGGGGGALSGALSRGAAAPLVVAGAAS